MSYGLKPCPFCGNEAQLNDHVLRTSGGHYTANVQCSSCDSVVIDQVYGMSRQEAMSGAALVWNTREPAPLAWSSEPPKAPGFYFVRKKGAEFAGGSVYFAGTGGELRSSLECAGPLPTPVESSK